MTPDSVLRYLVRSFTAPIHVPILLAGGPGVGKTSLEKQAAQIAGLDTIFSFPVYEEPPDLKGYYAMDPQAHELRAYPMGQIAALLKADRPTAWVIDDLGQGAKMTQAGYMQWIHARAVNGFRLPDCVKVAACTNRPQDQAGVAAVLEPVKSRFATIIEVCPEVDSWSRWAFGQAPPPQTALLAPLPFPDVPGAMRPEIVQFLRNNPALLHEDKPAGGLRNGPNPRTWENASNVLSYLQPVNGDELELLSGAVGEGAAAMLCEFLAAWRSVVNMDAVLVNPQTAPLPDTQRPDSALTVALAIGFRLTEGTVPALTVYMERMKAAGMGSYCAAAMKNADRRRPDLKHSAEWTRLMVSPLGALFTGQEA